MRRWLSPLAAVFYGLVSLRNWLFDTGFFTQTGFPVPVVSVGNLSVGGTGKTPVVAHLVSSLVKSGKKVCIVSRGYGGRYYGPASRVQHDAQDSAALYGDEPVWFASSLNVPVYVGRKRSKAVELCLTEQTPDIIIADDGFQHRWLAREKDIVLLDATESLPELLPQGRFREPVQSLTRADFVFLTKTNLALADQVDVWTAVAAEHGFSAQNKNFYTVDYRLSGFSQAPVHRPPHLLSNSLATGMPKPASSSLTNGEADPVAGMPREGLSPVGRKVLLVSAIARPESFEKLVLEQCSVVEHLKYPDHHSWQQDDMEKIKKTARLMNCADVVVTEKDFVKLAPLDLGDLVVHVAVLDITLQPDFPYDQLFT